MEVNKDNEIDPKPSNKAAARY
ncbi:hypothetical protein CCACVL1_03056 [Corchorus capsularis]|uniref:Uncharacterized protein n=1 Tax=Corchorus capsularis TaxID=210143 RepID=A0A1R3K398_COCAP|nr:hypothetical protein CCACVL1_03056 [Corchorus capsularis]